MLTYHLQTLIKCCSPAKAPKIAVEFNNINVNNSDYFTTSTFNNVVRSQVGIFFIMHENIRYFFAEFYCVIRDMVLFQHLSWCSGLHRLSYILCWQNRRPCLCAYQKFLHINPYGQIFSVSCILWDKCGVGFALKQLYGNYYWCLQTTRQNKYSRLYNKIEWNFVINFTIWPCIHTWTLILTLIPLP